MMALLQSFALAQNPIINSVSPSKPYYRTGELIRIIGPDVYDDPAVTPNCDSIIFDLSGTIYSFHPYNSNTTSGDPFYLGGTAGVDTVRFTIPPSLPCGTYTVKLDDDEGCNNGPGGNYSGTISITIYDSAIVSFPATSYCQNGSITTAPTIVGDPGTFSEVTGNSLLFSQTTGQLMLHSGTLGLNMIRFTTNSASSLCRDSTDYPIVVNPMVNDTLSYSGGPSFCQGSGTALVSASFTSTGGLYTCSPTTPALNGTSGAFDLNVLAGSYAITYTPPALACESPQTISIQVDSMVAAVYDFAPVYCHGSTLLGPQTATFLPPGGWFQEFGGTGLVFTDSLAGLIDVDASTAGTHFIEYYSGGGCVTLVRDTIFIDTPPDPFFNIQASICSNDDSIPATSITTPGGAFYCIGGAVHFYGGTTGFIDVPNSQIGGPFTIFYLVTQGVCRDTMERHVTIAEAPTATATYPGDPYCTNDPNPSAVFTNGTTGGTFSISPSGVIDSTSGFIDLQLVGPGNYAVNYAVATAGCSSFVELDSVHIVATPPTHFVLLDTTLCQGSGIYPIDTVIPAPGAFSVFTVTDNQYITFPLGITGGTNIDTDALPAGGPYRLVRHVDGTLCKDSLILNFWIQRLEDPTFVYAPDTFCQTDRNPVPLILGDGGGVFHELNATVNFSLVLDSTSGLINLFSSDPGSHLVEYTTPGPCPKRDTFTVVVTSANSPDFYYPLNSYCETDSSFIIPTISTPPPYHFLRSSQTLAMDTLTGVIDIIASDTGSYNVTLVLDSVGGNCPTTAVAVIEILAYNNSSISFDSIPCSSDSLFYIDYDSTISGVFFAPSGLVWEDRDHGVVAIYASVPATYLIRYEVNGVCQERFSDSLEIQVPTDPSFSFPLGQNEYCKSDGSVQPIPLNSGGIFSWTNAADTSDVTSIVMNPSNGLIDLSASNPGTFFVTYTSSGACQADTSRRIIIFPSPTNMQLLLDPGDSICQGDPLTVTGSGASFFVIREDSQQISLSSSYRFDSLPLPGSNIEVVFVTQQFCRDSLNTTVTVLPRPVAQTYITVPTILAGDDVVLQVGSNVNQTQFSWTVVGRGDVVFSPPTGTVNPVALGNLGTITVAAELNENRFQGYDPAMAIFTITPSAYGCTGETLTDTIRINPDSKPLFIPEVFTPNDDQKNDAWLIQWSDEIHPEDYTMIVYNRSGGEVFRMSPIHPRWTGDAVPDGVYLWTLLHNTDVKLNQKGALTIRRR